MTTFLISLTITAVIFIVFWVLLHFGEWIQSKISFLHDPVYVPSTKQSITNMVKLAQPRPGQVVIDLGSGDGRLLLAFARKGCRCIGYEINPVLVWKSRQLAKKHHLQDKMSFFCKSFWQADLSKADVVTLFMTESIMLELERKVFSEVSKGTKVVSQRFRFPNWKISKTITDCYLYLS